LDQILKYFFYDILRSHASCSLQLILNDPCPINKIVWSSFDHITGPELRFVWKVATATNLSPVALSTNSESTKDESVSTTSSISRGTNGSAYEDIDNLLQLHQTYLCDPKLQENVFLAKAITGLLRSQSHCVVVGDDLSLVIQVLNTLCLFVPEQWRWCSLKDYKNNFSPYLRLQTIHRSELPIVITAGVESHWPMSVIDVDKQLVCVSSNYLKHRKLKRLRQRNDVAGILLSAGIDEVDSKTFRELRNCHSCDVVVDFLAKMDFLPYERNARIGFIRQFMLNLENRARAFITYVEDASKPNPTDKTNAISSKWNLNAARRALDLTSESLFSIILAEAERLQAGIADFVCDTRSL
uniref:UDENN FLCN/SMCR8-type domain-containing protein n=1 Tax=Syphacia muris TaxID=451379 RepID=A0A0N5AQ27_9BILA